MKTLSWLLVLFGICGLCVSTVFALIWAVGVILGYSVINLWEVLYYMYVVFLVTFYIGVILDPDLNTRKAN